jgi:hypothetical protein
MWHDEDEVDVDNGTNTLDDGDYKPSTPLHKQAEYLTLQNPVPATTSVGHRNEIIIVACYLFADTHAVQLAGCYMAAV